MREGAPETLPLFPLDAVVLFPAVSVPLFIFEPRYRQLTRDALAGDRRIGMVAVRPEHRGEMAGDPALFEVGCEGVIARAEERPDGTWNLLLAGTERFRIVDEATRPTERPYRTARIERLDESEGGADGMASRRASIQDRLRDLLRGTPGAEDLRRSLARLDELDDRRFVDVLAQALDFDVLEKQQLLESPGPLERADLLDDLLHFRMAQTGAPTRSQRTH